MNVFEFQKKYPTSDKQLEAMKTMSDSDIKVIIASCGTPQGKKKYSDMAKKAKG